MIVVDASGGNAQEHWQYQNRRINNKNRLERITEVLQFKLLEETHQQQRMVDDGGNIQFSPFIVRARPVHHSP